MRRAAACAAPLLGMALLGGCEWASLPSQSDTPTATEAAASASPTDPLPQGSTQRPTTPPEETATACLDEDEDGYCPSDACAPGEEACALVDCDDLDDSIHPGAVERCAASGETAADEDCDGATDEGIGLSFWYRDDDGDGYGNILFPVQVSGCDGPQYFVPDGSDCDDTDAGINPGEAEALCDGVNQDCDAATDDSPDADSDGYDACDIGVPGADSLPADCQDASASIHPGAVERANSLDDDCDGRVVMNADAFVMGSDPEEGDPDEEPERVVDLGYLEIHRYEVSAAEYEACIAAGACPSRGNVGAGCNTVSQGRGDHPANCLSQANARSYCAWVGMRLPSEAEWERAARGSCAEAGLICTTSTNGRDVNLDEPTYPWGSQDPDCTRANHDPEEGSACAGATVPVTAGSSLGSSPVGALQMAGNVAEWVDDCYHPTYIGAPHTGATWSQDCEAGLGVIRGGSYLSPPSELRAAARAAEVSTAVRANVGFRCVETVGQPEPTPSPTEAIPPGDDATPQGG